MKQKIFSAEEVKKVKGRMSKEDRGPISNPKKGKKPSKNFPRQLNTKWGLIKSFEIGGERAPLTP